MKSDHMKTYERSRRTLYLALSGCIFILLITLIIQSFATYTLYHNALKFEERYLRETVDNTIDYIDSARKIIENEKNEASRSSSKDEIRKKIEESLRHHFYETASSHSYMWINEVHNYEGGDGYGIRLIHPNIKTREGELISTKTKDAVGDTPYLTELEGIKANGSIIYSYYFKNYENNENSRKMTYARLYPDYNWIICMGIPYGAVWGEVIFNNSATKWILLFGYLLSIGGICFLLFHMNRLYKEEKEGHLSEMTILQEQLEYDPLTQAYSRIYGFNLLESSLNDFTAYGTRNLIAIFDIDRFKSINDTYGHDHGDYVLKETTNAIKSHIRQEDFLIRWGGDEFIVLFFPIPDEDVTLRLQQLNECINQHIYTTPNGNKTEVTISIGAGYFKRGDHSVQDLLKRIDKALYEAKKTRNTYCFADDD